MEPSRDQWLDGFSLDANLSLDPPINFGGHRRLKREMLVLEGKMELVESIFTTEIGALRRWCDTKSHVLSGALIRRGSAMLSMTLPGQVFYGPSPL